MNSAYYINKEFHSRQHFASAIAPPRYAPTGSLCIKSNGINAEMFCLIQGPLIMIFLRNDHN